MRCLVLMVSAVVITSVGCERSADRDASQVLKSIYLGLKNYDAHYDAFPIQSGATWRWTEKTRFKTTSWRGLLLDSMASVGSYKRIKQIDLERQIEDVANHCFTFDGLLVHSNFAKLQKAKLGELPAQTILAFTVSGADADWTFSEPDSLDAMFSHESKTSVSNPGYLLLADGRIARVWNPTPQVILQMSDAATANSVEEDSLAHHGIYVYANSE